MWAKVQSRSSNVTYLSHGRLRAWGPGRNSVFCSKFSRRSTHCGALWATYREDEGAHFHPPAVAILCPHPTFRASHPRAVDRLSGRGYGVRRRPGKALGGRCRSPPPPRALRRSDSDHAKCGGVSITDSVVRLSSTEYWLGWENSVFWPKISRRST